MFKIGVYLSLFFLTLSPAFGERVFIVNTHLTGELNNMKAVANELGFQYEIGDIKPSGASYKEYDYVFHALGNTSEISALASATQRGELTSKLVNFGDPVAHHDIFETVVVNQFSYEGEESSKILKVDDVGSNIVDREISTSLVTMDGKKKTVAVLVGGDSKNNVFTPVHARQLAASLNQVRAHNVDVRFMVITSRRTSSIAEHAFFEEFKADNSDRVVFNDHIYESFNPYVEFLKKSDVVVVTGDSMSMISDSVALNKPTFIFAPEGSHELRHRLFFLQHFKAGRVKPFNFKLETYAYPVYSPNKSISDRLKEKLKSISSKIALCRKFYEGN